MTSLVVRRQDAVLTAAVLGDGSPIVLTQFFPRRTLDHFDRVAPGLVRAGFSLIAVDPRGVGGNDGPLENLTFHDLAADLIAVVDAVGAARVDVVASADAALAARCAAADHPDRIRRLVQIAPGAIGWPFPAPPDEETLRVYSSIFFGPDLDDEARRSAIQAATYSSASGVTAAAADYEVRASDATALMAIAAATPEDDWWPGGTRPTLLLQGADDRICPRANSRAFQAEFPDRARAIEVGCSGHMLVRERPRAVVRHVVDFLGAGARA